MPRKFLLFIFALFSFSAFCEDAMELDSAIVSIAKKIASAVEEESVTLGIGDFSSDTENLSKYISNRFATELGKNTKFILQERSESGKSQIERELNYQYASGYVSDRAAVDLGKQLGAKYLVYGYFEQLGSYLSLNVRLTNVETATIPVIESIPISSSEKLNELLGDSKNLTDSTDYLNMIARCRDKKTSIRREENQEKNSVESRINAEYQVQINEVNNRVQKRNQSDEVFARKKNEDLEKIISQRDNKIKSELDKITIKYNEQYNHVDLSEADLKKKLSQMTFTLSENAVIVRVDEFRNNDKPQNYPIMVQSVHHLVNYRYPTRYVMASSEEDNDDEFDMIEEAKENNGFSGEIKYSVLPNENAETFSIKILSVRVYLKDSGQTLVNDTVNKVIAENVTAASDIKVESSTSATLSQGKKLQGKTQSKKKDSNDSFSQDSQSVSQSSSSYIAKTASAKQKSERVSDLVSFGYMYYGNNAYAMNGVYLNALSSSWGHFFVDWINLQAGLASSGGFFFDGSIDAGLYWNIASRVYPFVKVGMGFAWGVYDYDDHDDYYLGDVGGFELKAGLGFDVRLTDYVKVVASYNLAFIPGEKYFCSDNIKLGIGFGMPVTK